MAYKIKTSAERYNSRMDKIWETYYQQQREKDVIAKEVYKSDYDKLSEERKRVVCHIWGDRHGI
jgi:hypothetical protein